MENEIFFKEQDAVWRDLGGGIRRSMKGYDNGIMMVRVDFEKGAVGAPHAHPHSQSSLIERGVFEVTIGGRKQTLKAGDCFFAPSGVDHGVVALETGAIIDVFAPAREDFL